MAREMRVPQHDLDAEAAVLSAILLDRQALDIVIPILKPEQFYSEANRWIYDAALLLVEIGSPIDAVTVKGKLLETGRLQQVGGAAYIAELIDAVPSVANIETYAKKVRDRAQLRELGAACAKFAAMAYDHQGSAKELVDQAGQTLFELAQQNLDRGLEAIGPAVETEFERLAQAAARGERLTGLSTGFYRIDAKMGGLHGGDLTIVAARPGIGKSAFVLNLAANVATRAIMPAQGVLFFSLEMPKEQLAMRLMCSEARVDLGKARQGFLQDRDWTQLTDVTGAIRGWPIWVDDTPAITLLDMRAKSRQKMAEAERVGVGISLIIVDYLQLMTGYGGNREQEISSLSRGLKRLAKDLRVPVVALSQLNRATETRAGKDKRPQLADLRESGAIEQDADNIIFIYRADYYEPDCEEKGIAELNVAKQRNGPTGRTLCRFEAAYTRFDNLAQGEHENDEDNAA